MPYSPTSINKSGQIYAELGIIPAAKAKAEGIVGAAQIGAQQRQQSAANWAQGISSFGSSLGGGISQAVSQISKNNMQRDFYRTGMESFAARGIVSPETMDKFSKGSLGTQQALWAENSAIWDSYLKSQQGEETLGREIRLKQAEADINRQGLGQDVWNFDKQTGQWNKAGMQTGSATITPTKDEGNLPAEPHPLKVIGPDGKPAYRRAKWDPAGKYWIPGGGDYIRDEQGNVQKAEQGGFSLFGAPPAEGQ